MTEPRFPTLDYDRTSRDDYGGVYEVLKEDAIEPMVAETDWWVHFPIRTVIDQCGPAFEIGPYTLTESDVINLYNALSDHVGMFPELFRRV